MAPKILLDCRSGAALATTVGRLSWPPERRAGSRAHSGSALRLPQSDAAGHPSAELTQARRHGVLAA